MTRLHTDDRPSGATDTQPDWAEQVLLELELHLPRMRRECCATDFWKWLRGEAESAARYLSTREQHDAVQARIDQVIKRHCHAAPEHLAATKDSMTLASEVTLIAPMQ